MLRNDFVILGFPKCGTTGLVRNLDKCSDIAVLRGNEQHWECPIYHGGCEYEDLKAERVGHKYTYYVHNLTAMRSMIADSPAILGIVCLRDLSEILVSWHGMHRRFAIEGTPGHFTTENEETRRFYAECSIEEYFVRQQDRFNFSEALTKVRQANFQKLLITDQKQIEERGADVTNRIRKLLNLAPVSFDNDGLRPPPRRARDTSHLPDWISDKLADEKRKMGAILLRWKLGGQTFLSSDFGLLRLF